VEPLPSSVYLAASLWAWAAASCGPATATAWLLCSHGSGHYGIAPFGGRGQQRSGAVSYYKAITTTLAMLLPVATWAQVPWVNDQTVQQELADGQVPVRFVFEGSASSVQVRGAVRINASPETIWRVLTDCEHAASFIPGVKRCHRLQSAADHSWEIIEQEMKYSWVMPSVTCVFRVDYQQPRRIDFKGIRGDLKAEEGYWALADPTPAAGSAATPHATVVEYELYVDPGFWIPRMLLRKSLRSELPAALKAVRARAESTAAEY
jgi:uncharacterized protein YndB with AHSA1/START domain